MDMAGTTGRPRLLDLYCGEGGAGHGYHLAGFDVTGVDRADHSRRYPHKFIQADALDYLAEHGHKYDVVHASPPCQAHTKAQRIRKNTHPDLITPTRELLPSGVPYVIENVPGSPLKDPVELCGCMFPSLNVYRERWFESNVPLAYHLHYPHDQAQTKMGRPPVPGERMQVVGHFSGVTQARVAMGMPWASREGLREAIPPAYTQFIGEQLLAVL